MPRDNMPQTYPPQVTDETPSSIDEQVRPCLRLAYPLPRDHADDRMFQRLLEALAQRTSPASIRADKRTAM